MKTPSNKVLVGVGVAAALLIGIGIGASGDDSEAAAAPEPTPAPTVTVTAKPIVETVEVTPQVCLDALSGTGEVMLEMSGIQKLVAPALDAAVSSDVAALEALTSQVIAHNEEVERLTPGTVSDIEDCQAAAK